MKTALLFACLTATACGGLENEPLTYGVVRGALLGATSTSTVSIFGRPDLIATPDSAGNFEITRVPQGHVDVLKLINLDYGERQTLELQGGSIADLGTSSGRPVGFFEVELVAPGGQSLKQGAIALSGTPISVKIERNEPEWQIRIPAGCYDITATVPGLGSKTAQGCASETMHRDVHIVMPVPDGSPGREGCQVTGCVGTLRCQADHSCRP
jgi:hypothetical protein